MDNVKQQFEKEVLKKQTAINSKLENLDIESIVEEVENENTPLKTRISLQAFLVSQRYGRKGADEVKLNGSLLLLNHAMLIVDVNESLANRLYQRSKKLLRK